MHSCNHATFNMKGDTIVSCDSYGVLKLWDIRKGAPMVSIDAGPHPGNHVTFDPSGYLAGTFVSPAFRQSLAKDDRN
ncbi:hypothetical protein JRQ81_001028 [Phrynocephalus forsythii]|uniref:Uncharacterized protein n=1 Tax=Phrynocephalus forsythii TaxID=171643 RepID=A0A9Q1B7J5_9SAUR|nr:hypothetical protein JRQ81_001028 [Phrynocephalus forsythii]